MKCLWSYVILNKILAIKKGNSIALNTLRMILFIKIGIYLSNMNLYTLEFLNAMKILEIVLARMK